MNTYLFIHNIGYLLSAIATLIAFLFLILNNPRSNGHTPLAFSFLTITVLIFAHILGVNSEDADVSKFYFAFNVLMFIMGALNVHAVISILDKTREKKNIIFSIYIAALILSVFFIIKPELLIIDAVPKMYFPNYYVPGAFDWIRLVFLYGICFTYSVYELFSFVNQEKNIIIKKQITFLLIATILGYFFGNFPNFLIYDIQIDPLWGMFFMVIFTVIFLYAAAKYELMNIKIIAKQALVFAVIIGSFGGLIIFFEYLSYTIASLYPDYSFWIIPAVSIVLVMTLTFLIWKKIREVDLLKYEFITTVTHKFRTPLTQIKWATDNLKESPLKPDDREQLEYILSADYRLVELTNQLVNITEAENSKYEYHLEKQDLKKIIDEIIVFLSATIKSKKIIIKNNYKNDAFVRCDELRMKFVIQTFIENSISYSYNGGVVEISLYQQGDDIYFSVKDNGIGIPKSDTNHIFSKFYRGKEARKNDTEGLGIGLFLSRQIIDKHKGNIWVESEGQNKGSTFYFSVPVYK